MEYTEHHDNISAVEQDLRQRLVELISSGRRFRDFDTSREIERLTAAISELESAQQAIARVTGFEATRQSTTPPTTSLWTQELDAFVRGRIELTIDEILHNVQMPVGRKTRSLEIEIAKGLKRRGWEKCRKRRGPGRRGTSWVKPEPRSADAPLNPSLNRLQLPPDSQ